VRTQQSRNVRRHRDSGVCLRPTRSRAVASRKRCFTVDPGPALPACRPLLIPCSPALTPGPCPLQNVSRSAWLCRENSITRNPRLRGQCLLCVAQLARQRADPSRSLPTMIHLALASGSWGLRLGTRPQARSSGNRRLFPSPWSPRLPATAHCRHSPSKFTRLRGPADFMLSFPLYIFLSPFSAFSSRPPRVSVQIHFITAIPLAAVVMTAPIRQRWARPAGFAGGRGLQPLPARNRRSCKSDLCLE
jgi:hypothetical protein